MKLQDSDDLQDRTIGVSAHDVAIAMQDMQLRNAKAVLVTPQEAAAAGLECGDTACEGCMTGKPSCIYIDAKPEDNK